MEYMDIQEFKAVDRLEDFDSFEEIILAEDAVTREPVFQNRAYREETANYKKNNRPSFEERFLSIDSFQKEFSGRPLVIEVAKRVRPQESFPYDRLLRTTISKIEEKMRVEISSDFYFGTAQAKHHKLLHEVVDLTMDYYGSPIAHLILLKGGRNATCAAYHRGEEPRIHKVSFP
ncbi:MAG: hypothetical protein J6038_04035, partial [Bacilli bacterium]|nr:hypothetical protein [Bacilli bacterium]